ncbi:hypothetical protein [Variovorax sp. 54]|uniref:hypothetical protein n=1 Tax=Variovorax sp. 54 TaxID=2035212 RepID=UPI00117E56EA|nr:hypothetical protein [Variovorax sp. 54]
MAFVLALSDAARAQPAIYIPTTSHVIVISMLTILMADRALRQWLSQALLMGLACDRSSLADCVHLGNKEFSKGDLSVADRAEDPLLDRCDVSLNSEVRNDSTNR